MEAITIENPLTFVSTRLVKETETFKVRPALKNSEDVAFFLKKRLDFEMDREVLGVICLSPKLQVNHAEICTVGGLDATMCVPKDVLRPAILSASAAAIIFHTHPSGSTKFSKNDYEVMYRMMKAGEIMGIKILDSMVITSTGDWSSMKDIADADNLETFCKEKGDVAVCL